MYKTTVITFLILLLTISCGPGKVRFDQAIEEQKALIHKMNQLEEAGKYDEAIPYAKKIMEFLESYLQQDDPDWATFLDRFAMLYLKTGQYDAAESLFKRSLEIKEKALGKEHLNLTTNFIGLLIIYQKSDKFEESIPYAEKVVSMAKKHLGDDHPDLTKLLSLLGTAYIKTGRYAEAEVVFKQTLKIQEKALGRDHIDVAATLFNLAEFYQGASRYADAEASYKRSLEIKEKTLGKEHPEVAVILNYLASFYIATSRLTEAEVLSRRSLEINEKVFGKNSFNAAISLDNLASAYFENSRYSEAEPLLKRSLKIKELLLKEDSLAGDKQAHAISLSISFNNLGALYTSTERYDEAELLLKRSLAIAEEIFGKESLAVARSLENLAFVYGKTGLIQGDSKKLSEVEVILKRALNIRERTQGRDHPEAGLTRNGMAVLYAFTNRHFESHRMYVDALTIAERKRENIFLTLSEKQKLGYMELNKWIIHGFIIHSAQHMKSDSLAVTETFNAWLRWKGAVLEVQQRYVDAIVYSERPDIHKKFEELGKIRREIARLQISGTNRINPEDYKRELENLEKRKETLEAELTRLSKDFALEKMVGRADINKITEILLKSDKESIYIDFANITISLWKGEKPLGVRYLVFLLSPEQEPAVKLIDISDSEGVDKHIKAYLEEMKRAKEYGEAPRERILRAEAKALYDILLKPLEPYIKDKKHLYISPDGNLNLIPFEVLINPEGKYLMEDYNITYIAAGRDIMRFADTTVAKEDPLIIADPDYDMGLHEKTQVAKAMGAIETRAPAPLSRDAKDLRFKRLPDTKQEADAIERILRENKKINVRNYQDKRALEEVLLMAKSPRILHLATHGYFLKDEEVKRQPQLVGFISPERERFVDIGIENPMLRSGIVLAGANASLKEGRDDGVVSAEKILGLRLQGTDLVVLSACDTGTGEVKSGEGVFGLKRAFILSGAKTVVMSLWSIPSKETTELMTDFYTLMAKGKSKSEALREARINLMKKNPNPFYWGAFIMVGNPN